MEGRKVMGQLFLAHAGRGMEAEMYHKSCEILETLDNPVSLSQMYLKLGEAYKGLSAWDDVDLY